MCYTAGIRTGTKNGVQKSTELLWPKELDFPEFDASNAKALPIFPVILGDEELRFELAHWLLVPPWVRDAEGLKKLKIYLANARVEEVETKKTYAPLMDTQRCAAVFSHFFEWRHEKGSTGGVKKVKHRVFRQDGEPLFMPGLFSRTTIEGEPYLSFTIFTMEARGIMRYIHNRALRQPLILGPEGARTWLEAGKPFAMAREDLYRQEIGGLITSEPKVPPQSELGKQGNEDYQKELDF
jgi:putative SOS response-associated peptidase YedK